MHIQRKRHPGLSLIFQKRKIDDQKGKRGKRTGLTVSPFSPLGLCGVPRRSILPLSVPGREVRCILGGGTDFAGMLRLHFHLLGQKLWK